MKNRLSDLNDHLFAQMERLGDEDLTPEQIGVEVKRGAAIAAIADQIVRNADLQLKAAKLVADTGGTLSRALPLVENLMGGQKTMAPAAPAIEHKPQ